MGIRVIVVRTYKEILSSFMLAMYFDRLAKVTLFLLQLT